MLIANSNLVGKWATWEHFRELERQGLMMYGQMTAGSWIYIGTQGILQGTYETFAELARQHFGGTLRGRVVLTAGLGGMGGAQPLAVTMNEGVVPRIEVDETRPAPPRDRLRRPADARSRRGAGVGPRRRRPRGDAALDRAGRQRRRDRAGLGDGGERFDVVTDQTSAHDALGGYVPGRAPLDDAHALRDTQPDEYIRRSMRSMADHVRAMLAFQAAGAVAFDYGNNLRAQAQEAGVANAFDFPGFVPAFIRPQFCEGRGPFRWAALSGDPADIRRTDEAILELFPRRRRPAPLDRDGRGARCRSRGCRRASAGWATASGTGRAWRSTSWSRSGEVRAPIVIGRDHLDSGSVASPNRETEAMRDGTDAVADWPLLNALVNTAAGRDLGVDPPRRRRGHRLQPARGDGGRGRRHGARGAEAGAGAHDDPGMGVVRHVDAGYERAIEVARERGVHIPMLDG